MRVRPLWVALAILSVPAIAGADGHRAGFFGAYSGARGSVLKGVHFNVDYGGNNPDAKIWAAVVDYSVHNGKGFKRHTFTGGVSGSRRVGQFVMGAQALGGRVWGDGSADWAGTFGGNLERVIWSPITASGKHLEIAPRVQTDWIVRSGNAKSFWRVSGGIVVRVPKG
jgi:hypothetical protein